MKLGDRRFAVDIEMLDVKLHAPWQYPRNARERRIYELPLVAIAAGERVGTFHCPIHVTGHSGPEFRLGSGILESGEEVSPVRTMPLPDDLTPREADVLWAAGHTDAEIATELYISEVTVKSHINHLFSKIRARNRAEAVRYAYHHGLVAPQA